MSALSTAIAPAGRRRFWLTVVCFLILNSIAWVVYDRTFADWHRGTLRVEAFEPGDNAVVDSKQPIRWHFSDDVLPTTAYGKDPGRVNPSVAGRWAWENPRTLSFIPAIDLPRATPVTFTLATDLLRTGTGAALKQPFVSRVHSSPLAIETIKQCAAIDDDQFVVEMKFNDRVSPGDVLAHTTATLPDGHTVHCRLYGQAAGNVVRFATDTVPLLSDGSDTTVVVKLGPGLTGLSGPLGLEKAYETVVNLGRTLVATHLSAVAPARGRGYLNLVFNNEVDTAVLKKVLTLEPSVPFTIDTYTSDSVLLHGDFQAGTRYTLRISAPSNGAAKEQIARSPKPCQLATFMPDKGSDIWFDNDQGYLSTAGNRTLLAHAVNVDQLRVSITQMYDNNLVAWRNAAEGDRWVSTDAYSKPIATRTIPVPGGKNVQHDVPIDLDDLLPPGQHAGVWRVSISRVHDNESDEETSQSSHAVVTLSDVGLTAKQTREGLVAWATSLHTAKPLENVRIRVFSSKNQLLGEATTDADGLARIAALHPAKDEEVAVLLADMVPSSVGPTTRPIASELTWLDVRHTNWELGDTDTGGSPYLRTGNSAFVYTDRGVYRPGETVHLRAIVRSPGEVAPKIAFPVKWQLRRPDQKDWKNQTVMLNIDGAAAADIALPTDLPSGRWSATLSLPGNKKESFGATTFLIEDFIPNRLKVSMDLRLGKEKDPKRYMISNMPLQADVQADYLFGRHASGLAVDVANHASHTVFTPTGWDGWSFGDAANIAKIVKTAETTKARPTHRKKHQSVAKLASDDEQPDPATLDDHGHYHTTLNVTDIVHLSEDYLGPWMMTTDVGVREAGGRAVTVTRQIMIDALPAYIGAKLDTPAKPGENGTFQIRMIKPDGSRTSEEMPDLQAELLRETWNTVLVFREGRYHYDSTRVLASVASTRVHLEVGVGEWNINVPDSGQYVARFTEPNTGAVTTVPFYCTDGSGWDENVDRQNPERLDIKILGVGEAEDAAKKSSPTAWHVGDTARVLIASPFKGRLLLSTETDDVVQTQVIDMTSSHTVVPVKVTDACWPNAFVSATVIRAIDPNAKWQTHRAFGVARLNVDSSSKRLQITLDAPPILRPSQSLDINLKVTDPDGNAVENAAVTVAAVDEGICSLTDFKTPDPLKFFSSKRALGVQSGDLFGLLMPEVAKLESQREVGGDKPEPDLGRYRSPVGARRVKPVALAWAEVHTDANGYARASFPLPQFEGRLRIIAVGYTPRFLGSIDRGATVQSPILVQSSWPRFAAPGDRFTVPVVLFNNTKGIGDARVSVQVLNPDLLSVGASKQSAVSLPQVPILGGGQRQVNFDVTVAQAVGVAKIQLTFEMGQESYHEETELPIRPASPLTQVGSIANVSTTRPTSLTGLTTMMQGTGSLRVSLTQWPTLNLPRKLDYLDRYPYGCVEQTTSCCFPLIALGEIGKQSNPEQFDPERIRQTIDSGITRMIGMQTSEGGLSMWAGQTDAWPWGSVYTAHFLTEAKTAGYEVPSEFYNHLLAYVRHLNDAGTDNPTELEVQSYAAYVMTLAGKTDRATLDRLTELTSAPPRQDDPVDGPSMRSDAQLMLASAWLLAGRRDLAEGLMPDAIPSPRVGHQMNGNLGSSVRDRALLIMAMEQIQPNRAELPELVQKLADQNWSSTQDAAFSSLAIGRYLRDMKKKTPYESGRLLLGDQVLFEGKSIAWTGESAPLHVELSGPEDAIGHLSWLQTGVPVSPPKDEEHGLKIHRQYLSLDGQELHGTVRTGELVRVQLTIEAPPDEPNLVIEDLLPAGLEAENPRLETASKDRDESEKMTFGNSRVDFRDDRVIVAGSMPSAWKAHCSYLARAVTPGIYTVPPVRCEAMYDFNTNAMSGSGTLTVVKN